jgi:hypothetical protein
MLSVALVVLGLAIAADAADPGRAVGTVTISGTTTALSFATEKKIEGLLDPKRQDTLIVLTDKPLGPTDPADEVGLSLRARTGEIIVLALRFDGHKLINVKISHKGLSGLVMLPANWFQYSGSRAGSGTLKLSNREFDGRTYACSVEFSAAPYVGLAAGKTATVALAPAPGPANLPPATTSNVDRKAATALLIAAMQNREEHQAVELIKLGADPNGRDQSGTPVLNWAVMMCQPAVVQALVNAKANLTYQRAPGLTILTEAGACPAAEKILRAAGAK